MPEAVQREPNAPPILGNAPGSFPWNVFQQRHPKLIQQIRDTFPYPPRHDHALQRLAAESATGIIAPLDRHAHDHQQWDDWGRDYYGRRWIDVPFLWAESYFYRILLDVVGYFEPGPWAGIDPFAPFKNAELDHASLDSQLDALDRVLALPAERRARALLQASLWGNRADLGFALLTPTTSSAHDTPDLVADDSALLWGLLTNGRCGVLSLVADNAGQELLADLVLCDHLLTHEHVACVTVHVKPHPYYVSDATTADLLEVLRRLHRASERLAEVGHRLWTALHAERLVVDTHPFHCAPLPYHHMPPDLAHRFSNASLTLMKGDLNYRRLVGDRHWPPTTSFDSLTRYFPGPVAALRTLKSDVVVGIDERTVTTLDATVERWRTTGAHALVQVRS